MKRLTPAEQVIFKKLLIRGGINVLDLDSAAFNKFAKPIIGYDLWKDYQGFAANIMSEFLQNEEAEIVVKLMEELLNYAIAKDDYFEGINDIQIYRCREIIKNYKSVYQMHQLEVNFDSDYLHLYQTEMFENITKNPTLAIGQAKELVESCCKSILEEEKITINKDWDINQLVDETLKIMDLMPKQVDLKEKGSDNIKALLGNLKSIPNYLAQLRNSYGNGHGKSKNFKTLTETHARLAVGASLTFVGFVWDTYKSNKID